ncbi:MAG: CoB--CoM heterodisulfide reductase iron-sulfur subunit A family protein [Firmicutes bacterium]|nr:CoB--CoM heterodisulfide reductase iron-sulfur subunit A family protein [Bacillota bacterium]
MTDGERRIGVYICHCGGNIADHVDVDRVVEAVKDEPGVAVAKAAMFACSDATQQEMTQDIREKELDGLVVASCSPKLHQFTFREVARRGGLNPYRYTQVNIREQCSWAHTDDKAGATEKAIRLVRAGIARARLGQSLEPIVVETVPRVLVVGAGIAGLRAATALADVGLQVVVVEKEAEAGGWVRGFGEMYPHGRKGRELIGLLMDEVRRRPGITVWTRAELVDKSGSFGNFRVKIRVRKDGDEAAGVRSEGPSRSETISTDVGAVIVATGFETYQPLEGEYGFGLGGVVTLPEFRRMLDEQFTGPPLSYQGKPVRSIAYIYCVGSRQAVDRERGNRYCSRYCCNAAGHAALRIATLDPQVRQYHLFRDIRTYGKFESIYTEARAKGSVYVRFDPAYPPVVAQDRTGLHVTVKDLLTAGRELDIPVDLVVLVTGMVPRENEDLVKVLKLPVGNDGFYSEIHPKLRPVETVVDGVLICGACQGPKNSAESVGSALAASAQSAAILKKGYAELEPLVAEVDRERCDDCGLCYSACPYGAIARVAYEGGNEVAQVNRVVCKGCGACVPVCPSEAIDLLGYTDKQIRAMIDGLVKEIA